MIGRLALSFAENLRMLRASRLEAVTDALTGLGNRRALEFELHSRLAEQPMRPFVLAFYDLDGFKTYNDTFGHQAGDVLLARLGARVVAALPQADIFRLGGDEFCVLMDEAGGGEAGAALAAGALASAARLRGWLLLRLGQRSRPRRPMPRPRWSWPTPACTSTRAGADRMRPRRRQDVFVRALLERNRELGQHNDDVADMAVAVCREIGLETGEVLAVRRAAELHDVGKLAIPDTILNKPGPLDDQEWEFMRRHTIVGERIVASATSLQRCRAARPLLARALGRGRLSGRPGRRGDPARRACHRGLRRLRRDDDHARTGAGCRRRTRLRAAPERELRRRRVAQQFGPAGGWPCSNCALHANGPAGTSV